MALFDRETRELIEKLINQVDVDLRTDFSIGIISSENEYTSVLTAEIRNRINARLPLKSAAFSQKLKSNEEQAWGVDACVLLIDYDKGVGKLCLFEAKSDRPNWDYLKPNYQPPISHFSSQIARQVAPNKQGFVVWEQFYSSKPNGTPIGDRNPKGSTCILHHLAFKHNGTPPNPNVWTDNDIDTLALEKQRVSKMGSLVRTVCKCKLGKRFDFSELEELLRERIPVRHILFLEGGRVVSENNSYHSIAKRYQERFPDYKESTGRQ